MASEEVEVKVLEIPSSAEALPKVVEAVEEVAAQLGLTQPDAEEVAIALTEAVNNAIYHGNGGVQDRPVAIRFDRGTKHLRIRVRDQGPGFDPDAVPDPLAKENLLKPSGRGILVMQSMMDEVEFVFSEGGTEVMLLKRLSA